MLEDHIHSYIATRIKLGGVLPIDGYITGVPKKIAQILGDAGNVGAGSTLIQTVSIPAGTLKNGDILYYEGEFDLFNNGNLKAIQPRFDSQPLSTNDWQNTIASTQIYFQAKIYRSTATTFRSFITGSLPFTGQANPFTQFVDRVGGSNMDTTNLSFTVSLFGAVNNDIIHRVSSLWLIRD
jgi:hypothetical protein